MLQFKSFFLENISKSQGFTSIIEDLEIRKCISARSWPESSGPSKFRFVFLTIPLLMLKLNLPITVLVFCPPTSISWIFERMPRYSGLSLQSHAPDSFHRQLSMLCSARLHQLRSAISTGTLPWQNLKTLSIIQNFRPFMYTGKKRRGNTSSYKQKRVSFKMPVAPSKRSYLWIAWCDFLKPNKCLACRIGLVNMVPHLLLPRLNSRLDVWNIPASILHLHAITRMLTCIYIPANAAGAFKTFLSSYI